MGDASWTYLSGDTIMIVGISVPTKISMAGRTHNRLLLYFRVIHESLENSICLVQISDVAARHPYSHIAP